MAELGSGPAPPDGVTCPWCGSDDVERIAAHGPQLLTDQWQCGACRNFFGRIASR